MQNKDPNDYKANPDFLIKIVSHLGVSAILSVEWCGRADGWLTVHEETFEELEEGEFYLTNLGLQRQGYDLVRFARTSEIYSNNTAYAAYSEEFYGFTNSYIGGTVLLGDMANLIEELLASIPRVQKTPDDPQPSDHDL